MKCCICGESLFKAKQCETCNGCAFKIKGHYEKDGRLYCESCWRPNSCVDCPPKEDDDG